MPKIVQIPISLGLKGEYRAIVHKGDGVPLQETSWGKNIITAAGLDEALTGDPSGYCVAGDGNTAPSISDTTLASYLGKMTSTLSRSGSNNNNPGSGALFISTVVRVQFVPGAFGASPVNIAEAGFTRTGGTLSSVDASTALFSRGLLVDGGGLPTTVAVQPDEYLDVLWKFTVNLPYDVTGSFSLDNNGTPVSIDYKVRPLNLTPNASPSVSPWGYVQGKSAPNPQGNVYIPNGLSATNIPRNGVSASSLVLPSSDISYDSSAQPNSCVYATYTPGDFYRDVSLTWTLSKGNVSGGIKTAIIYGGFTQWQIEFTPVIPKDILSQLTLVFRTTIGNTP